MPLSYIPSHCNLTLKVNTTEIHNLTFLFTKPQPNPNYRSRNTDPHHVSLKPSSHNTDPHHVSVKPSPAMFLHPYLAYSLDINIKP